MPRSEDGEKRSVGGCCGTRWLVLHCRILSSMGDRCRLVDSSIVEEPQKWDEREEMKEGEGTAIYTSSS